jgi:hypothetical protein
LTMIMRGTPPRALSWRGCLAVLGLGALLLPLLPAWAQAQPPAKDYDADGRIDVKIVPRADMGLRFVDVDADGSQEDAQKAKAELQALEAQLAQKQAEVGALAAKVAMARAKVAQADGALKARIVVEAASDANNAALQDLLKKIQALQGQGAVPEVIVVDQATGKIMMKTTGAWPKTGVKQPGSPIGLPAAADTDKRIDELEMKLKSILDEVEKLRHERKPGAPETSQESPLHSYGPTPLEKVPYIGRLFMKVGPAAEDQAKALAAQRDALQKSLEESRAGAEADKARGEAEQIAAAARRQEAEAEVKVAQAQAALAEAKAKGGAATAIELKQMEADVAVRRAVVEQAKSVLQKIIYQRKAFEEEAKASHEDSHAAEDKIKQLEELLKQKEKEREATPSKP